MDYASAFKKPFTDVKKLIIGILLSILPIINLFATGFMLNAAKNEMKKKKMLPEWAEWGQLFVKGLLAFVIGFIYAIPVMLIGALLAWPTIKGAISGMQVTNVALGGLGAGMVVVAVLGLLLAYIVPSAILHYISSGRFGDAFKLGSVFKKAFCGQYFMAWVVGVLYSLVLGTILGFVPIIGGAAASFITGLTMFSLLGEIFPKI